MVSLSFKKKLEPTSHRRVGTEGIRLELVSVTPTFPCAATTHMEAGGSTLRWSRFRWLHFHQKVKDSFLDGRSSSLVDFSISREEAAGWS